MKVSGSPYWWIEASLKVLFRAEEEYPQLSTPSWAKSL